MVEIAFKNVKKSYGINEVLKDATFELRTKEKACLVGENGAGKTTILKLIKKIETPDDGKIEIAFKESIGYLEQIPNYGEDKKASEVLKTAFQKIDGIQEKILELQEKMQTSQNEELEKILKIYDTLNIEFEALDGYNKEINYKKICNGLKFTEEFLNKKFNSLSGGEKTIVLLGKTLLEKNKIILLDEPTNHLDIEMVTWLENYIKEYEGTILIVSHDRYFLDKVITKTIEIEDGVCKTYPGNYSYYKKTKEEEIERQYEMYKTQQKKIKAMEEAIRRLKDFGNACHGDKNPFFKRAFNMEKRLEKMDKIEKVKEKKVIRLNANVEERSANNVVKIENISKSFKEKNIFERANLNIYYRERVALIGKNGAGKSTLIKMLLGSEKVDSGKITIGNNVEVAYLEQNVVFENNELTILEYLRGDFDITEEDARKYLARFLFFAEEVNKKISVLSGGEKSRLRLAKILYSSNNLLILDEPTNHLDIDSREQIEELLLEYKGTILFVSHDRYFINKVASKVVELSNKKLNEYNGTYEYYLSMKEKENIKIEEVVEIKKKSENEQYIQGKKIRSKNNQIRKTEDNINKLEKEIEKIDFKMEENKNDYIELQKLFEQKQNLENELNIHMEKWIEYQENP